MKNPVLSKLNVGLFFCASVFIDPKGLTFYYFKGKLKWFWTNNMRIVFKNKWKQLLFKDKDLIFFFLKIEIFFLIFIIIFSNLFRTGFYHQLNFLPLGNLQFAGPHLSVVHGSFVVPQVEPHRLLQPLGYLP